MLIMIVKIRHFFIRHILEANLISTTKIVTTSNNVKIQRAPHNNLSLALSIEHNLHTMSMPTIINCFVLNIIITFTFLKARFK